MHKDCDNVIDASLTTLISINLTFQHINKILEATCGLSIIQWSLLKNLLEMPAVSPFVLATALKVTPGTLSQTMPRLIKKKYIFSCTDPKDARKKMISITRAGKERLEATNKFYQVIFADIHLLDGDLNRIDAFLRTKSWQRLSELNRRN